MRRDLIAQRDVASRESGWTLKDPLSLAYFHLRDAEYVVLAMLDGTHTYRGLLDILSLRFPAERWSVDNLKRFLASLIQSGLVTSLSSGQGTRFANQQRLATRRRRAGLLTSWLAIRWQGIDPEPLLRRIEPWTRWVYRPTTIAMLGSLVAFSAALVAIRWEILIRRMPDAETLLGFSNLLPLVLAFVGIKLLHELGHVLTCRHFGDECHELGIQLLMFVPLFYGDVTDAWMQSRRWPRIAISSAGIVVELVLAAVATILWWCSVPGFLNSIFLNVMLVCSVNTLLFNGNPLLRYDGYYVLADLLGIPNLAMQSRSAVLSVCERVLIGASDEELEIDLKRWWALVGYGFASAIYRWFVLAAIVWFLHQLFAGIGLSFVATGLSVIAVTGAVLGPVREFSRRVRSHWESQTVPRRRMARGCTGLGLILIGLLFIPLPYSVRGPFVVYPADASPVFVTIPGQLESTVRAGQTIDSGEVIGRLTNHGLQLQLERQRSEVARLAMRLQHLETQRGASESSSMRLPAARDAFASAQRQLEQLNVEAERLQIVSPTTGTVLPPPNITRTSISADSLPEWIGTPLDAVNRGATVREQTLLCYVGDASKRDALILIDQDAVEFVRVGQKVGLQFQSSPGHVCEGLVEEIATSRSDALPREIIVSRLAANRNGKSGPSAEVNYEVRVRLTSEVAASLYSPGRGRIRCGWLSLGSRLWRLLRHTFSTELSSVRFDDDIHSSLNWDSIS